MQSPIGPLDDDEDYDNAVVVTAATMMTTLTMMLTTRMMTTAMAMTQGDQLQVLIRHSLSFLCHSLTPPPSLCKTALILEKS